MNAWWLFRVECGVPKPGSYGAIVHSSKPMQLSDAQAEAELVKTMAAFANKAGCIACALQFHDNKWKKFECRPVGLTFPAPQPKPAAQPMLRHTASPARAAFFAPRPPQRAAVASPLRRPWPMRGVGGCVPCGMGAESDAYVEAAKVIDENPPGEQSWFIKHWPLVLVGGAVLAGGMIYIGARN